MATKVFKTSQIELLNGQALSCSPLKIKYMREFMDIFVLLEKSQNDEEAIDVLLECCRICMKQYSPDLFLDLDEHIDLNTLYDIIEIAAGINIKPKNKENEDPDKEETKPIKDISKDKDQGWFDLDLAKLESEVFTLGIWKNYEELETSLSIPELMQTLSSKRELDYEEKKFLAAIQGVDLDDNKDKNRGQKEWEDMKARVFSGGKTSDGNDVLSLQGANATRAGFGIGMGLDYEDLTKK
jgi:hypothetical protein